MIRESLNAGNVKGMTPLHAACLNGNRIVFELLVKAGGQLTRKDSQSMMPVHYAVVKDHAKILQNMHQNLY